MSATNLFAKSFQPIILATPTLLKKPPSCGDQHEGGCSRTHQSAWAMRLMLGIT